MHNDDEPTTTPPLVDEPTDGGGNPRLSVLGDLKSRREQIKQEAILVLAVPRWDDPEVLVRYRPADHKVIRRLQTAVEKAPKERRYDTEVDTNIDLLIKYCESVFARIDGQEYSLRPGDPKGDPTTFDPDLARNLGLDDNATARQTVKALFITDGDLLSHAQKLIEWSGYKDTEADEALEGE